MEKIKPDLESLFLFQNFEELIKEIFILNEFDIDVNQGSKYNFRAKFDNNFYYVGVKLYQTKLAPFELLKKASQVLSSSKDNVNAKLILVISSVLTSGLKEDIFNEFGVIVLDIKSLFTLSFDFGHTYYELERLLVRILKIDIDDLSTINSNDKASILSSLNSTSHQANTKTIINIGADLCLAIRRISPGRAESAMFEIKCTEALKYLFDNKTDLTLWERQPTTGDTLHRFDLLCRIVSYDKNFWAEIAEDFHTRYVIFEFKNYTNAISQSEIYTTEKYLFLTALRSVSFIVARNGADSNSKTAVKNALKENGKLIVILDLSDLCDMLYLKDNGEEPSVIMRKKMDEILLYLTI